MLIRRAGLAIVHDLDAVGVALGVAGEGHARQRAVPGRGEQRQAVVVVRPGTDRLGPGLEDDRGQAAAGSAHERRPGWTARRR